MKLFINRSLWIVLAVVVGLGGFSLAVAGLAVADPVQSTKTLTRIHDPVVITGEDVLTLTGTPVDQVFAYVLSGGTWRQIPFQIDEITPLGFYTETEDAILDANDEIVFMAQDTGDRAQNGGPQAGNQLISPVWYEVEVTDPLEPTQKGWVYLVRSESLASTVSTDYVNFNRLLHQIVGENFRLGFSTEHTGLEYMALGGGLLDILDRSKTTVSCTITNIPELCPITEETLPALPDLVIADGPVRVIARGGRVMGYRSMVAWERTIVIPRILSGILGDIQFSVDFNQNASGATLYNAVVPAGVTVDGITDTVPATPLSPWWQLSTDRGSVVQVMDFAEMGGDQRNYYVDNAALDPTDRGDQRHYGDIGVIVSSPNLSFTYRIAHYYLTGDQPNVGETYFKTFQQPLEVTVHMQRVPSAAKVYLPHIRRDKLPTPKPSCLPNPGDWRGQEGRESLPVSLKVTSDCQVSEFSMTVPFQDDTCTVTAERNLPIFNDRFAHIYLGGLITGTFTSPTQVTGLYRIVACNAITLTVPISGTWMAQHE